MTKYMRSEEGSVRVTENPEGRKWTTETGKTLKNQIGELSAYDDEIYDKLSFASRLHTTKYMTSEEGSVRVKEKRTTEKIPWEWSKR